MGYHDKSPQIKRVMDDMALKLYGITVADALQQGVCVQCKEPALPKCYSRTTGELRDCFVPRFALPEGVEEVLLPS